jgi:hypothetical protein
MSNQLRLRALNERLRGTYYIGSPITYNTPENQVQPDDVVILVRPKPVIRYVHDPETESIESMSVRSDERNDDMKNDDGPRPLEYRITGITWHTPSFVNTCNLDNFLSAWVRKMRQTHGKYLKYVQVYDRVGYALFRIADHALCAKERVDAEFVKGMWLTAILKSTNESERINNPPIDCTGCNTYSVFQHLENHSLFTIVSFCLCGTFFHTDFCLEVFNLKEIEILGNPKRINEAQMPHCLTCNQPRILLDLNPLTTNWILTFNYNGHSTRELASPLLSEIPQIVEMKNILYKLEYITYIQDTDHPVLKHEVSMQFIRHSWYLYDGERTPKFRRWGGEKYDQLNCLLDTLVYFRI